MRSPPLARPFRSGISSVTSIEAMRPSRSIVKPPTSIPNIRAPALLPRDRRRLLLLRPLGESASAYEKAVELGGDAWSVILQADALMFAGQYAEARVLFDQLCPSRERQRGSEYWLKIYLLNCLADEHGLSAQAREVATSAELIHGTFGSGGDPDPETRLRLPTAIQVDGLNAFAGWKPAAAAEKKEEWSDAGMLFICTAIPDPRIPTLGLRGHPPAERG